MISEVLRFYLLSTHYRSPIDFSDESLKVAKSGLDHFYVLFQKIDEFSMNEEDAGNETFETFRPDFETAMDDDFNTARAIGILQEWRTAANQFVKQGDFKKAVWVGKMLRKLGGVLGIFCVRSDEWRYQSWELALERHEMDEQGIQGLISEREEARRNKHWAKSDEIRNQLAQAGVMIEDRPDGTTRVKH